MNNKNIKSIIMSIMMITLLNSCGNNSTETTEEASTTATKYPSDVMPFMDQFNILCGDGTTYKDLVNVEH